MKQHNIKQSMKSNVLKMVQNEWMNEREKKVNLIKKLMAIVIYVADICCDSLQSFKFVI